MMASTINSIILTFAVASVVSHPEQAPNFQCGGSLESDSGTITYSSPLTPTLCIWTIHLPSTSMFRIDIPFLQLPHNTTCSESSLRVYPLNNLLPQNKFEGQSFCQTNSSTSAFYLPETVIAVIFTSTRGNSAFTLNWEGISPNAYTKTHESTVSTASSGYIRYPAVGSQYPPDTVSTWVIQPSRPSHTTAGFFQLQVSNVNIESCNKGPPQDCLCDALLLYEVKQDGSLDETSRVCGNATFQEVRKMSSNFILAFFSDHESTMQEQSTGFELTYSPFTQPPTSNVSTSCGGIVEGTTGLIEYKLREPLDTDEICVWTIRSPGRTQIKFTVNELGLEHWGDVLDSVGMSSSGNYTKKSFLKQDIGKTITFNATVVILHLSTYYLGLSSGFSINFEAGPEIDSNISTYTDVFKNMGNTSCGGDLRYEPDTRLWKDGIELSTFTIQHLHSRYYNPFIMPIYMNITDLELSRDVHTGECDDRVQFFYQDNSYLRERVPSSMRSSSICSLEEATSVQAQYGEYLWTPGTIVVFLFGGNAGDQQGDSSSPYGFGVHWDIVYKDDAPACT